LIRINVSYQLIEYLSFLNDHLLVVVNDELRKKGKPATTRVGWFTRAATMLIGPPALIYKRRRVGDCEFLIDEHRLLRRSLDGELDTPWSDVKTVYRYSKCYLVEKQEGAMPLPYRCFSLEQRTSFDELLSLHGK
jgi:hypothetical protein